MQVKTRKINKELLTSYGDDVSGFLKPIYASRNTSFASLNLRLNKLLAPNFSDLDKALTILTKAFDAQKNILIIGDFDADGATSCAVMVRALRLMGYKFVDFLVPNRFSHGYGLSVDIVELARKEKSPDVIITVDNGIVSFDGVLLAKSYNIEVIITDHHLPNANIPKADAIINPNLVNCNFASKNLCGVGVAFYLCVSLNSHLEKLAYFTKYNIKKPNLSKLLDIVALGTIADMVVLDQNNRILVNAGLQIINNNNACHAISTMLKMSKKVIGNIGASDLGFIVAPKINASGRLDDISIGVRCLITDDINIAYKYAKVLNDFNKSRKELQADMEEDTNTILKTINFNNSYSICLYDENYHEGVIGIVAGKLSKKYNCPSVIFAKNGNMLKGSIRSINSVHIKDLLDIIDRKNPNLIAKFGGHSIAAGLSIKLENLTSFKNIFDSEIKLHLNNNKPQEILLTDGVLMAKQITLKNAQLISNSQPWGQGFDEPTFYGDFYINNSKIIADKHLRCELSLTKGGLFFNAIAFFNTMDNIKFAKIIYKLSINNYNNIQTLQLVIDKIIPKIPIN